MKKVFVSLAVAMLTGCVGTGSSPTLYGIVAQDPNHGFLISIDPASGGGTLLGDSGISMPGGLTYDESTGNMYVINSAVGGQVYTIDLATGAATPLSSPGAIVAPAALAYRFTDNSLYTFTPTMSAGQLVRVDPATGSTLGLVGVIGRSPIGGLAVRPSDGVLFGAGRETLDDWLFTISTTPSPSPLETDIAQTNRLITGLTQRGRRSARR